MRKPQEPGGSQRRHRACKQEPEQVSIRFCSWVQRLCKHHCFKVCSTATARFSALCTFDKWFDYVSQEGVSKTLLFMQAEAGLSCWSLPPQRQTRNMWSNPSLTPISMISLQEPAPFSKIALEAHSSFCSRKPLIWPHSLGNEMPGFPVTLCHINRKACSQTSAHVCPSICSSLPVPLFAGRVIPLICLSAYLSVCLSVHLSACFSTCIPEPDSLPCMPIPETVCSVSNQKKLTEPATLQEHIHPGPISPLPLWYIFLAQSITVEFNCTWFKLQFNTVIEQNLNKF